MPAYRPSYLVALLLAPLLWALALAPDHADARQACDKTAKRGQTPRAFVGSLSPGMTGCFPPGTYRSWFRDIKVEVPRVTLMSKPGARRARIVGRLWIARGANRVTVRRLRLDGRSRRGKPGPLVHANHVAFRRNNVTNRHSTICFLIGSASRGHAYRTVIRGNRIHDCGRIPPNNHDHGIYVQDATRTVIQRNWIFDNANRGIQLYPNADGSLITGNVIAGNGQGLNFACDRRDCSQRNVVARNVISHSTIRWNVRGNSQGARPDGSNVLRGNCVWATKSRFTANGGVDSDIRFFSELDNLVALPRYVNRAGKDFRLRARSPCRAILG